MPRAFRSVYVHPVEHEYRRQGTAAAMLSDCWDGQVPPGVVGLAMRGAPGSRWCPWSMPQADAVALRSLRMDVVRVRADALTSSCAEN